jgi:hypothetical protein
VRKKKQGEREGEREEGRGRKWTFMTRETGQKDENRWGGNTRIEGINKEEGQRETGNEGIWRSR